MLTEAYYIQILVTICLLNFKWMIMAMSLLGLMNETKVSLNFTANTANSTIRLSKCGTLDISYDYYSYDK